MNPTFTRRTFAGRFASALSALGVTAAVLPKRASAQNAAAQDSEIRKLNSDGKPGSEKDAIMPVIVHRGLIYVAGQGAHDSRDAKEWTIESHTTMVMDKIKKHVEIGGGTMDSILQLKVEPPEFSWKRGLNCEFNTGATQVVFMESRCGRGKRAAKRLRTNRKSLRRTWRY